MFKEEIRNRFNLISEKRVNMFEQNSERLMKISWKIRKLWQFEVRNLQETFLDQSIWICKWMSWWCHRLTIFHSFCTQKWQKFHNVKQCLNTSLLTDLPHCFSSGGIKWCDGGNATCHPPWRATVLYPCNSSVNLMTNYMCMQKCTWCLVTSDKFFNNVLRCSKH